MNSLCGIFSRLTVLIYCAFLLLLTRCMRFLGGFCVNLDWSVWISCGVWDDFRMRVRISL